MLNQHRLDLARVAKVSDRTRSSEKKYHKALIRRFEKRKLYSSFKNIIWGAELIDMHLISKFQKAFWFLLFVIDIYSKYELIVPLKDKKGITISNAFQKFLDESNCKPKKYG